MTEIPPNDDNSENDPNLLPVNAIDARVTTYGNPHDRLRA